MSGLVVLFVGVAVLIPLLLYWLTERETADPTVVSRSEAEQLARESGGRPNARQADGEGSDRQHSDGEWGSGSEWGHDGSRR